METTTTQTTPLTETKTTSQPSNTHFLKKKMSPNMVNLLIILIISFLLLLTYVFAGAGIQFLNLRVLGGNIDNLNNLINLLPLRVGIGFVFLWYGIDNFEHPQIFNNLFNTLLKKAKLEKAPANFFLLGYLQAVCEIFVAVSMVTGLYIDLGSLLGTLLLFAVLFAYEEGLGSLLIRDIGLLGGTFSLFVFSILK